VEVLSSETEIGLLLEYAKSNLTGNKEIKEAITTLVILLADLKKEINEKNVYIEYLTSREKERERKELAYNERLKKEDWQRENRNWTQLATLISWNCRI